MFVPLFHTKNQLRKTLSNAVTLCVLTSLLAGLLPPSLGTALPLLSTAKAVQAAADIAPLEEQPPLVEATTPPEPELAPEHNDLAAVAAAPPAAPDVRPLAQGGPASISGQVYSDFNDNGVKDTGDVGVGGMTVTAYDATGAAIASTTASTTTTTLGQYTLSNLPANMPLRLEFTTLPVDYQPTAHGSSNGTSVQFVTTSTGAVSNVNFGINIPVDYCQNNPSLCVPEMIAGDPQNATTATFNVLKKWSYEAANGSVTPINLAKANLVGTVWGLAYARRTDKLYSAAFLKRHTGLGPNGLGAIYVTSNPRTGTGVTSALFFDVATIAGVNLGSVPSNSTRGLTTPGGTALDAAIYDKVGKVGLGDIDISDDESTLWTISLNDKKLISLPAVNPSAAAAQVYSIPDPGCAVGSGDYRPFGLGFHRGKVYVGVTCDASISLLQTDLKSVVYRFDPANPGSGFVNVLNVPLNYTKQPVGAGCTAATLLNRWHAWVNTPYPTGNNPDCNFAGMKALPQPLLSDIDFDLDGSLILGFIDRFAHQFAAGIALPNTSLSNEGFAGGDILRAYNNNGTYVLENNGTAGPVSGGVGNNQGPGGGDFYLGDFVGSSSSTGLAENATGGLAFLPGSGEAVTTVWDPFTANASQGVAFLSNTNGNANRRHDLGVNAQFGKGTGLGDLELLCDAAPLEIGNRVWKDANGNGVQDPGELPLFEVQVSRQGPTNTVTTLTDAEGRYYFSNLRPNTTYTLTIDTQAGAYQLTTPNAGAATDNNALTDVRDSDATLVNNKATIVYTTGGPGENNHSLDFGFTDAPLYDLALIKTLAAGQAMTVTGGSPVTFTVVVKNQGDLNSGTFTVRDQLPTGLTYVAASGTGFNACTHASGVVTCVYPVAGINAGQTVTITLRATVESGPTNTPYRNWAEISADSGPDIDSTPDTNTGSDTGAGLGTAPNDAVINHNDINHAGAAYDQTAEDEDDNDYQDIVVNYDLALIKTLGTNQPIKVAPGAQAEFSIVVKNQGNTNSGTFTVRDQLPTGLTYVSASGTGFNACSNSSGVVTCVYPAAGINPGQTVSITLRATVESVTTNAPYRNWAEISADSYNDIDSTPDSNSGTDTGAGTGTAPNDAVIDHNDINHAGAAYDQATEDEDDNDYQDLVPGVYDLALIKTLAAGQAMTVTGGATVTFTLTVKNQGDVDSGTFTVRDQLPTGLTYVAATGTNFTCTNASGVVTCPYTGNLASGDSATIALVATVETIPNNTPYRNWAEISVDSGADVDSTPDTNSGTDTGAGVGTAPNDAVINHDDIDHAGAAYDQTAEDEDDNDYQDVVVNYDLALIKTLGVGQAMTVTPGATVTFTVLVKNQGNTNSGTFTVRDQLPTGLTYVAASGTGFNACANASGVVTCVYPATGINAGQTVTVTLRATVEATPNNAPYRNWAEISADSGNDIDSTPDTNSGTDTGAGLGTAPNDTVINHDDINHAGAAYDQTAEDEDDNDYQDLVVNYDLALIKTLGAGQVMTVTPGATVTFTLVIKNQGGINSGTFTVRDQLPTGLTYVSASGAGFNACANASGVVTCVYPATGINPGQTVTITLRATVESAINNAPYRNWAEISADSGNDIDSTPDTNSGTDTGPGTGTAPNDPVINHDDINHAGAAYDQPTEDEDDNDYQDLTAVYDLALIKTLAAGGVMTVTPGATVTFTLVVKNQGTVNSGTFTVRDQLPTGLTYVAASGAGFNACTNASGVVTCVYPATGINPGQTATVNIVATVEATPNNTPYRNWAEISADSGNDIDSTPDTNSGTDTGAGLGTNPNDAVINHDDINHAGAAYDQTAEDEDDNDYQDVVVNYDLALIKTLGAGQAMTVTPGTTVTFTVIVKNQGNTNSGTFTVRDQLPTGLTYVSASGAGFNACSNASGVVTCIYPATGINPGQTVTVTVRATVEATPNNTPYRNWAEISADSGNDIDSTPDTNSGTDTGPGTGTAPNDAVINHDDINHAGATYDQPTEDEDDNDYQDVVVNYDLALIKTLAPRQNTSLTLGGPVTFTVVVKNQGGVNSGTFTVRDQLPAGLTYVSASGTGFNACSNASGVVTCVYPATGINPGQTVTVTVRATVEATPDNAPYRNWAEISADSGNDIDSTPDTNSGTDTGPGTGTNPNDAVIDHNDINHAGAAYDQPSEDEDDNDYQDVDLVYDLALIKTLAVGQPLTVTGGAAVAFTVVVKNQGSVNSGTFTVRDQLPTGLTYVSASGTGFNACTNASGVVTCVYPASGINAGETVTITLNATVEANGVNAPYRNWAEISADSGGDRDSTPDTNSGTDTGVGVGTAPNDAVINHDDINHAGAAYDQTTEDEDDNDYQDINVTYDLALIKTLAPGQLMPVAPGATVDFLITVKNQGTAQSGVFTVRDQLPTGLTYVSGVGTNFSCSASGQAITCNYTGNLAPAGSATITLRALVESTSTNAPYRNWAEISSDSGPDRDSTPDTNTGSDTGVGTGTAPNDAVINHDDIDHAGAAYDQMAEDEDDNDYQDVTVATTYDLALIKTLAANQPMTVTPGAPVAFTVVVKNQGTLNSGAFTVRDQLPTGLTYVSATGSNFTCSHTAGVVTCIYTGNLAQGTTATLTVNAVAEQSIDYAPYRNWAEISADSGNDLDSTPDTNTGQDNAPGFGLSPNDAVINHDDIDHAGAAYDQRSEDEDDNDYAQVNVATAVIDLALVKVATPTILQAGQSVTYTLRIKNQGTVASGSYTVTDRLPTGFTFVAASNSGSHSNGVVTWASLPSLAPNATQELTLRVTVPLATAFGDYTNWAEISRDSGVDEDSAPDTNTGQDTTPPNDSVIDRTSLSDVDIDMAAGDEDDNDPATVTVSAFDLALVKVVNATTIIPGQPVTFTLRVKNQGNVAAGVFTVRDAMPTGTAFISASDGGTASGSVVTWNLSGLAVGASKDLTLVLTAPATTGQYTNWAEISADGAPTGYTDQDSTPDTNTGHDTTTPNDLVIDRTSLSAADIDTEAGDEDDNDLASFTVPGDLPTGSGVLTVTKTINGIGSGLFNVTVTGPSGYLTTTTVTRGTPRVLTGLAAGVYTVTEQAPGWSAVYSATTGVSLGSRAVVTLTAGTIIAAPTTPGTIAGNVYRDFDADGVDDGTTEPGVAGIVVTAYDRNGVMRGTATSDTSGNYTLNTTGNGPYRVEFTNLPADNEPSKQGTGNGTSTQFVTTNGGATNINFGIYEPCDYCQANPLLAVPVYLDGDPLAGGTTGAAPFMYGVSYSASGVVSPQTLALGRETGSTWGIAYQRSTKLIFAGTLVRRYVGLGPLGTGGIYRVNVNTGAVTQWLDLKTIDVDTGSIPTRPGMPANSGTPYGTDPLWQQVGKMGIGDIDISEDEKTLYVMSPNTKELVAIDIASKTLTRRIPVPDPGCAVAQDARPWAVKIRHADVYVGVTCTAETTQSVNDLSAHVMKLVGNSFVTVYSTTQPAQSFYLPNNGLTFPASPWSNAHISGGGGIPAEPLLSDIEIGTDGSLYLGFMDRFGLEAGHEPDTSVHATGGTLYKACPSGGSFIDCGYATTINMPQGALAIMPSKDEIVTTAIDPIMINDSVGLVHVSTTTFNRVSGAQLPTPAVFSKMNNLGDLEVLCDPPPLEIGNRVWKDLNSNGVQDPGEPGINGLTVSLQGPTNTVTTVTSGDGNYYFANLRPSTPYTLTINPAQTALNGLRLTAANTQAISGATGSNDPILDTRDSDGLLTNGTPVIFYTTELAGQNNHGLDFGFTQPTYGKVTITNTRLALDWGDDPDMGITGPGSYNTTVTNTGAAHVIVAGLRLGTNVDSETDGQPNGTASGDGADEDGVQFPTLTAGSTAVLTVTATNTGTTAAIIYGWIDFNGDGQFTASERVTTTVPAGTVNGVFHLTYSVPANAVSATYARFRLSTDPAAAQPTGVALDGEVEDYSVTIEASFVQFGDRVWLESDADGLASTGVITPVVGIVITATDSSGVVRTTTTNSAGYYSFTLPVGTYTVTYGSLPASYGVTIPSATPGGRRESGNAGSYAQGGYPDQSHANGTVVTLTDGQANWHLDFAFREPQVALRLTKQVDQTVAKTGATLTYMVRVTNDGPDIATGVQVEDLLPATVTYQGATPQQGTYNANTGIWNVGTVAVGSSVSLTITVTVK